MPYDPRMVQPMREEMVRMGAQELTDCRRSRCRAGRPAVAPRSCSSIRSAAVPPAAPGRAVPCPASTAIVPQQVVTVFAGVRIWTPPRGPASTSATTLPAHLRWRFQRWRGGALCPPPPDRRTGPQDIAKDLVAAFDKFCATTFGLT